MVRRVQLFQVSDFTGGLNVRDDPAVLAPNELADCKNVRVMPHGGLQRRKTVHKLNTSTAGGVRNLWSFFGNGVAHLMTQDANDAKYSTGSSTFTAINPDGLTTAGIMRAATMSRLSSAASERCYVQRNAENAAWKWSGSAATVLTNSVGGYNDNIAAPAGGRMPLAKFITTHSGYMFHANTVEAAGAAFTSRVRWSHPGEPEDYRTNDYIDVGVDDGDQITGICSTGATLYVFKTRSVWALTGYDPSTFQLAKVADRVGAVSQEAIAKSEDAVYFFDGVRGMFAISSGKITWLWPKLATLLSGGTIQAAYLVGQSAGFPGVTVGWLDARLWVGVPYGTGATGNTATFVFDPQAGGAWYRYEFETAEAPGEVSAWLEWTPPAADPVPFVVMNASQVVQLEYDDGSTDVASSPAGGVPFVSSFRTAWFTAGPRGVKKRWRRPTFVLNANIATVLSVKAFVDYRSVNARNQQQLVVIPEAGGGKVWGVNNWGADLWGPALMGQSTLVRGSAFGNAFALQLDVGQPRDDNDANPMWGVESIEFRYLPQRVR